MTPRFDATGKILIASSLEDLVPFILAADAGTPAGDLETGISRHVEPGRVYAVRREALRPMWPSWDGEL